MKKIYHQQTNAATKSKWQRMCNNCGWSASTKFLNVGFSTCYIQKNQCGHFEIVAQTTYHKTNFKSWKKTK